MVKGLWNYAIKATSIEKTTEFYVRNFDAEVRIRSEVLGSRYHLLRLGDSRLIIFDKTPYEDLIGRTLPPGYLHDVYEVDDFDEHINRLRESGVRFIMEPQEIEADFGRRRIAFFENPDGMRTEVMQVLEDSDKV